MTVIDTWNKLKNQFDAQDAETIKRLVNAYGNSYVRIQDELEALIQQLEAQSAKQTLSAEQVQNMAAYRNLLKAIKAELTDYSSFLKVETTSAVMAAAKSGLAGSRLMILDSAAQSMGIDVYALPKGVVTRASPEAMSFLDSYLAKDGPLFKKIDLLSDYHAQKIADGITDMVRIGKNPRVVASWITDAYGMGLTDSMRICRTAQLYSYRQANNVVQVANADLLQGVVWCADLNDDRTCMSCIALHGTVFPVGTVCDDHHLGRCNMLPWVKGMDNPIDQTGEDWFNAQPEERQRSMMGDGKYEAWKDNKFEFSQLSTTYDDDVYGEMRRESSLKELIGE